MDLTVAEIAWTAANGLIQAMTNDAWLGIKSRIAKILGRGYATEPQAEAQLEHTLRALASSDTDADVRKIEVARWAGRLEAIFATEPEISKHLSEALAELIPGQFPVVHQDVLAGRDAYTAGRDQYIRGDARD
ncbi:hypothetical protein [Catellatospora paridis]|uniref:hypothetical protein n=1 Tax=Catellatospora paridis TaxID=1617086 RepID=UPI0012D49228|nr:hypothetical protein [Catellatospora paridis]